MPGMARLLGGHAEVYELQTHRTDDAMFGRVIETVNCSQFARTPAARPLIGNARLSPEATQKLATPPSAGPSHSSTLLPATVRRNQIRSATAQCSSRKIGVVSYGTRLSWASASEKFSTVRTSSPRLR